MCAFWAVNRGSQLLGNYICQRRRRDYYARRRYEEGPKGKQFRLEREVLMNSLPRLITFTLLLLFSVCFLFRPLQATDERAAAGPLAEPRTANNSAGVQEAAAPVHAEDSQPGASEAKPLFPVVEHGKWGYMDKAGKIVIPPQYYDAGPFKEGMARVQPWRVPGELLRGPIFTAHRVARV
jgi:hypothetical protein